MDLRKLTPEEEKVIIHKGTERPFSGIYVTNKDKGIYRCKQCDTPLFTSSDKFDSGCGWPSFDDAIPGTVRQTPDADGQRIEITCARCGAHLGHVFTGERFTEKNTRYCVNSVSLQFTAVNIPSETAYFAAGCFWGVEYYFKQAPGVISTRVGYTGGKQDNPTYSDVSQGDSGHAETVEVVFDPMKTTYDELVKLFFEIHDFTQMNRQGPDIGTQYRTEIFYTNESQKITAEKTIKLLENNGYDVATKITPAQSYWVAEDYHQDYYTKSGKLPYCHARRKIF